MRCREQSICVIKIICIYSEQQQFFKRIILMWMWRRELMILASSPSKILTSWLDKQPLAAESLKVFLMKTFFSLGSFDLHHFWPNVANKALLLQFGDTFSYDGKLKLFIASVALVFCLDLETLSLTVFISGHLDTSWNFSLLLCP